MKQICEITIGQRFGKLEVKEKLDKRRNGYQIYLCRCDCDNMIEVTSTNLRRGKSKSCGCTRTEKIRQNGKDSAMDISGQTFGDYIAIRPTEERKSKSIVWEFKCQYCGAIYRETVANIRNRKNPTCSCRRYNKSDITGQLFDRLKVVGKSERKNGAHYLWECKCSCGKTTYVTKRDLVKGNVRSCGCLHSDMMIEDLTDKTFNYLKALYPTKEREFGSVVWICECTLCHTQKKVSSANLKSGGVKSCGCHINTPEHKAILNPLGINMGKIRKSDTTQLQKNNTSCHTGVCRSKKPDGWTAYITVCGASCRRTFKDKTLAVATREAMKDKAKLIVDHYDSLSESEKRAVAMDYYEGELELTQWLKKEMNLILDKNKEADK